MIEMFTLSRDQRARIDEWRDKWMAIGLCTDPANFEKAELAARLCYDAISLPPPKVVLRMGSPIAASIGGITATLLFQPQNENSTSRIKFLDRVLESVRSQIDLKNIETDVWEQARSTVGSYTMNFSTLNQGQWSRHPRSVWGRLRETMEVAISGDIKNTISSDAWLPVQTGVQGPIANRISPIELAVTDEFSSEILLRDESWMPYRGCQLRAPWYAYVSFFRDVCGWKNPSLLRFQHVETMAMTSGWSWWNSDVVAISDRPRILRLDENGRLHSETGPALEYPDGWCLHYWHGVSIPREWTQGKPPSPMEAMTWPNLEQRRAAISMIGWNRILRELESRVIDQHPDPAVGTLIEVKLPDLREPALFLRVLCGTGREFAVGVPPGLETVEQAQAWLTALPEKDFRLPTHRT
jgi:hypothetical protein